MTMHLRTISSHLSFILAFTGFFSSGCQNISANNQAPQANKVVYTCPAANELTPAGSRTIPCPAGAPTNICSGSVTLYDWSGSLKGSDGSSIPISGNTKNPQPPTDSCQNNQNNPNCPLGSSSLIHQFYWCSYNNGLHMIPKEPLQGSCSITLNNDTYNTSCNGSFEECQATCVLNT